MKKMIVFFCLYLSGCPTILFAQDVIGKPVEIPGPYKNSVYVEFLGNGIVGSINYERLIPLSVPDKTIAIRVGGAFIPLEVVGRKLNHHIFLPFEATIIKGQKPLKLEAGFGVTYWHVSSTYFGIDVRTGEERFITDEFGVPIPMARIGGRWQKPGSPFVARFGLTPLFVVIGAHGVSLPPVIPLPAASFGYCFGRNENKQIKIN